MKKILFFFVFLCLLCACKSTKNIADKESPLADFSTDNFVFGQKDTTYSQESFDGSGDGVFGRKIIYRDLTATKAAVRTSGKVVFIVCINNAGLVTYAGLIGSETTIKDKKTLRAYLKAATGYKFQPDASAPVQQCGKLRFTVYNSVNYKIR
jgi:hypothetical protein